MEAKYLSKDESLRPSMADQRPLSMEYQRNWLLDALYRHEHCDAAHPVNQEDRKLDCPDWQRVVLNLEEKGLITIDKGLPLLNESGLETVQRLRALNPDGIQSDPPFQIHVGPIGTGKTVRKDPEVFDRLAKMQRSVLGLEMEAAAIGYVANQSALPSIIVKGVADYGDHEKDDSFHEFAAQVSAEFLLTFLKKHAIVESQNPAKSPPRRHQLPSLDELAQMFAEIGFKEEGPFQLESNVSLRGLDSRDDEFIDVVLSVRGRRLAALTLNDDSDDEVTGILCASELEVPFYIGMDILQTRLMRVDQPDSPITTIRTADFVANASARSKFIGPHSLSYAHLPAEHAASFDTPPIEDHTTERDRKQRVLDFFRGYSDSWIPIQMGLPLDLDVEANGKRLALSTFVSETRAADRVTFLKIFGPGGSGKTTAARKLAWQLRKDGDVVLFRLSNSLRVSSFQLRRSAQEYRSQNRRLYLFWDSPTMFGQTTELLDVVQELRFESNVTVIVTDREDEWIDATRRSVSIRGEQVARIHEGLNDRQAEELFRRISELDSMGHSLLAKGQTLDSFKQALASDSNRILLSAVYEATTGQRFEEILVSEFQGIPNPDAQKLYLYLCGLFAYGVTVPELLLQSMYGRVQSRRMREEALAGILYVRQRHVWPRHRTISELLWKALTPDVDAEVEVFHDFLDELAFDLKVIERTEELDPFCRDVCQQVISRYRVPELAQKATAALDGLTPNSDVHLRMGRLLETLGKTRDAIPVYESGIHKRAHAFLFIACGRAYLQQNRPEKAIETFEAGLALRPHPDLYDACGRAYLQLNQPGKAIETFEAGLALTSNPDLYDACGRAYLQLNQPEKAIETFEAGLSRTPNPDLFNTCGRTYLKIGDPKRAIETFEAGLAKTPTAFLFTACGGTYLQLDQPKKAIETFEAGLAHAPDAVLYAACGNAYLKLDQPEKAIETFEAGLAKTPTSVLYAACGKAYLELNQPEKAIATLEAGLALTPSPHLFTACGSVYLELNQPEKAIETFEAGLALTPNPHLFFTCGKAYLKIGNRERAIETFEAGLAHAPDAVLYAACGRAYLNVNHPEKAIETFEAGLAHAPDAVLYAACGRAYLEHGQPEKAISTLENGIASKNSPLVYATLGDVYCELKQPQKAIAAYEAGLSVHPTWKLWFSLGSVWHTLGERDKAIACFESSIEIEPHYESFRAIGQIAEDRGEVDFASQMFAKADELRPTESD